MRVAGIDFSSHAVDVVTVPYEGVGAPVWTRFPLVGADAFDRARSVAQAVPGPSSVFYDDCLAIGIEHPAGHHGTGPLLRIQGSILARIPARMLVQPWPPSSWRKANGLAGNCSKDSVAERSAYLLPTSQYSFSITPAVFTFKGCAASEKREWCGWPQDAHDAHLIALATLHAITKADAA